MKVLVSAVVDPERWYELHQKDIKYIYYIATIKNERIIEGIFPESKVLVSCIFEEEDLKEGESFSDKVRELRKKYIEIIKPYKDQIILMVLKK